ncbi:MAG: hypothetical protein R3195_19985 [Gemmatimonadota bacterium]|nr:hypothetical protein [Gemmatimonadota bacterium]
MLEEAIFFTAGAIFTWVFARRDHRRRTESEERTRAQIHELRAVVEETLTRIGSDEGRTTGPEADTGGWPAEGGPETDLQAALLRLKSHLEETDV